METSLLEAKNVLDNVSLNGVRTDDIVNVGIALFNKGYEEE